MATARFCIDERPGEIVEAEVLTTWGQRLKGLLGTRPDARCVVLARCSSVHTFGMGYELDVAFVGELGEVLEVRRGVGPGEVLGNCGASCVFERPARPGAWLDEGEHLWVCAISADSCR